MCLVCAFRFGGLIIYNIINIKFFFFCCCARRWMSTLAWRFDVWAQRIALRGTFNSIPSKYSCSYHAAVIIGILNILLQKKRTGSDFPLWSYLSSYLKFWGRKVKMILFFFWVLLSMYRGVRRKKISVQPFLSSFFKSLLSFDGIELEGIVT